MENVKQIVFKIDTEEYGLNIMDVNGIEKYVNVNPVPNAPKNIEGLINLRGDVIPVFSLRSKFGLPRKPVDDKTMLIVTKSEDKLIAFEVDEVCEILETKAQYLNETPKIVKNTQTAYIDQVANIEGRMILILNLQGILSEEEQQQIDTMISNL